MSDLFLKTTQSDSNDLRLQSTGATEETPTEPPALQAPASGSQQDRPNIILDWANTGADEYQVQVARDDGFNTLAFNEIQTGTTLDTAKELDNDWTYFWRVRGINEGVETSWSEVWTFDTDTSPLTVTRVNPGEPVFSNADTVLDSIYYFRVYRASNFPEVETDGADFFALYSTDHAPSDGPGGIAWGTFNNPDLSDFQESGLMLDADEADDFTQMETPYLVRNPEAPDGKVLYLYEHSIGGGGQVTRLWRATEMNLDQSETWEEVGTVMPVEDGIEHTGYRTVRRWGNSLWHTWGLAVGGSFGVVDYRTSNDGITWDIQNGIDIGAPMPVDKNTDEDGRVALTHIGMQAFINGTRYIISTSNFGTGGGSGAIGYPLLIPNESFSDIEPPHYVLVDSWRDSTGSESENIRSVGALLENDGTVHIYYQTDNNLFYAQSEPGAMETHRAEVREPEPSSQSAELRGFVERAIQVENNIDYWFEWGEVGQGFPNTTAVQQVSISNEVTALIEDLAPGTQYQYRLISNGDGTESTSDVQAFETLSGQETVTRSGTVTRDGNTVQGAEVVLISKSDLIAAATATTTTDSSGGYTVDVPTGEEMVVIGLDGEDGDSAAVTEDG